MRAIGFAFSKHRDDEACLCAHPGFAKAAESCAQSACQNPADRGAASNAFNAFALSCGFNCEFPVLFIDIHRFSCTAAMMAREDGGVVDAQNLVYGTERLSIVDASVWPLVVASGPQASVYAMAEKVSQSTSVVNVTC